MSIRQIVYLIIIVLFSLVTAFGLYMIFSQPIVVAFFPGLLMIFRSCLRLYMFPNERFDPYTGFSKDDSAVFIKYNRIVSIFSMIVGMVVAYMMFKLW